MSAADEESKLVSDNEDNEAEGQEQEEQAEGESVDLGFMMGVLSRHQLEMVLVKFIMAHPESDHLLFEACENVKVTENELSEEAPFDEGTLPLEIVANSDALLARAARFLSAKDARNGLVILNYCTRALVASLEELLEQAANPKPKKKRGGDDHLEEEKEEVAGFLQALESLWELGLNILAAQAAESKEAVAALKQWFETLAAWRIQLQPVFGPVFSDPLRAAKKGLKEANSEPEFAPVASSSGSSSSSSSSSGKASGQKRRVVSGDAKNKRTKR